MDQNFNKVPPEMRDLASKSIEQAKKAFEGFFEAAAKAETSASLGSADFDEQRRQIMAQAEVQVEASLDFAKRMSMAKSIEEIASIQKQYVTSTLQDIAIAMKEVKF